MQYNNFKRKSIKTPTSYFNLGFLNLSTIDTERVDNSLLWGLPWACGMILGLGFYPLDFSSTPSRDNQERVQTLPNVPLCTKSPLVENYCFNDSQERTLLCFLVSINGLEDIKNITCFSLCSGNRFWILCSFHVIPALWLGQSINSQILSLLEDVKLVFICRS